MEEEHEELNEEEMSEMKEYFDKEIWPKMKKELKDATKREACFACFVAGTDMMRYAQEEEMRNAKEEFAKMKPEDVEKMIRGVGSEESLWEDKTKVNGSWIDDEIEESVER